MGAVDGITKLLSLHSTILTGGIKLGYHADSTNSGCLNNVTDILLRIHVSFGIERSLFAVGNVTKFFMGKYGNSKSF